MRYAFIQELTKLASKNKNIILLTADLGFTVFEEFAKKFPKQFLPIQLLLLQVLEPMNILGMMFVCTKLPLLLLDPVPVYRMLTTVQLISPPKI